MIFLGDTTRRGLAPVAVIGFVIAVASALALARFGEAGQDPSGHPAGDGAGQPTGHPGQQATASG